jgi:hypothetical protein
MREWQRTQSQQKELNLFQILSQVTAAFREDSSDSDKTLNYILAIFNSEPEKAAHLMKRLYEEEYFNPKLHVVAYLINVQKSASPEHPQKEALMHLRRALALQNSYLPAQKYYRYFIKRPYEAASSAEKIISVETLSWYNQDPFADEGHTHLKFADVASEEAFLKKYPSYKTTRL